MFQRSIQGSPTWSVRRLYPVADVGAGMMRDAGAVGGPSDIGDAQYPARSPEVEAGIQASIWRGVARELARSAGDPVPRTTTGRDREAEAFDPRDPASMTRERWATMGEAERRAWIDGNVRNESERIRMYSDAISGGFTTVQGFVNAERDKRLAEIRETATTERERIRADADVERARIDAEVRRAQVEADRLRAEAERLRAESGVPGSTTTDTARLAAEERARAAEAEAARLREQALATANAAGSGSGSWSTGKKVAAGVGGAAALALVGIAVREWMAQRKRERIAQGLPA